MLSGKINYISDSDLLNSISFRLYTVIKNNISNYLQIANAAGENDLDHTVDIEQLNKAQSIVTDLNNFIPPTIFEMIGEEFFAYLTEKRGYNKISAVRFIADNFHFLSSEMQTRFFNFLLPEIIPYGKEKGIAHKYHHSLYVDNIGYATTAGYLLLKAFSLDSKGRLNIKNTTLIINDLLEYAPEVIANYIDQFSGQAKDFIEKYAMLLANSYPDDGETEIKQSKARHDINRRQYCRYYSFVTKEMLTEICSTNQSNGNDLAEMIVDYLDDPEQKFNLALKK
jgi:hypothetical protein